MVHGEGEIPTDSSGKFAFPVSETRFYRLTAEKAGYTYAQRVIHIEKYHAFAVDPIYLKQIDPASTTITSAGGTHVNSTGKVIVEFPSGAVTEDITASATQYDFGDSLPGPLPGASHFTAAVELQPDGITFETPVRVLVENSHNFPPGTPIPVGFYRKDLGLWVHDGMCKITPDGQYMEYWIKHFSGIDLNGSAEPLAGAGIGGENKTSEEKKRPCSKDGKSDQSKIVFKDGELMEDYYLPSFKSLGKTISHRLVYRSFAADPRVFIGTRYNLDSSETTIPETTEFTVKIAGTRKTAHFAGSEGDLKQSYLYNGIDYKGDRLPTGIYPYEIELANWYPTYFHYAHYFGWTGGDFIVPPIRAKEKERFAKSFTGILTFENLEDSSFGVGWSLAGIPRLIKGVAGRVLMTEGSGDLKIFTPKHTITTAAGNGTPGYSGDGGPATDAEIYNPWDVATDEWGNFYIADTINYCIRKVDTGGIITTAVAGTGSTMDVAVDFFGNTYFPQYWSSGGFPYSHIVKVDTNGIWNIVAGGGNPPGPDYGDGGPATEARLFSVSDVAVDVEGNIYIVDQNRCKVRKVDTNGIITTVAGTGTAGYSGDSGLATNASLNYPTGVVVDADGNLYIADQENCRVRKVDTDGIITTVAGNGYCQCSGEDGTATEVKIKPEEVTVDEEGNLYISTKCQRVRKVDLNGILTTVAGIGTAGYNGDGIPAIEARLRSPRGVGLDPVGNLHIADTSNHRIRKVFIGPLEEVAYESPEGDYSTFVRNPGFTFTQTLKDGIINQFDTEGYLTSTTDLNDNTTTYDYDDDGNLVKITYPTGQETNFNYTAGLLSSITDPAGRETTFEYDADNNLIEITDLEGYSVTFDYIRNHLLHEKTDKNGNITQYNYDSNDLIESVVSEGGSVVTTYQPSDAQGLINSISPGMGTPDNPADPVFPQDATYTDPNGHTYTIETDMYGRALKTIDPSGNVTEYERGCDCGAPTKIIKPNGAVTTTEYDDMGNLLSRTEQIDEYGTIATYTYEYDPIFNKVTKITDPENNETDFEYDASSNLIKTIDALDNETVFTYDSRGLLLTVTDALDHVSTNTYDALGNLETSSDPLGNTTNYEYDLAGNLTKTTDAEGNFTTYSYDLMNRLLSVTDDLNNITSYTYNGNGNMLTVTDAENNTTTYEYDAKGRKTRSTDAENNQINLVYDPNGNLITVTDANENTTTYTYDEINRLIQKTYHDGEKYIYSYDEIGNKITETDPNGNIIEFDYDLANRLITKTYPDTSTESYTYDVMGRMLTGTNADSALTYTYDDLDRVEQVISNGKTIDYDYDVIGNRTSMTTPEGETIQYTYNDGNQISRMQLLSNSKGIDYIYDASNRVVRKDYSGGSYSTYVFDDVGKLENIIHLRSDDSEIYAQDNVFDKVSNITSKTTGIGTTNYDYDKIYQLNTATHPTQPQEDFTYDPVGNRLTSTDYSDWSYNDRNQMGGYNGIDFIYDLNGNTIAKMDATGTTGYTYNYENRLIRVDFPGGGYATYKYDVRGRRIEKNVNGAVTKYLYDGNSLLAEYDGSDTLQRNYFYGGGDINPSILYEGSSVYFFNHDHLNTTQTVTDESGTILWEAEYKSFGEVNITTETVSNNHRFPGQYFDQESGLHYNYHRYYGSETGRYLRADPMGIQEGMNHLYVYVQNNPLRYIDPQGLKGCGPGSGVKEWLIPDYPAGYDFSGCCDEHDDCYGCEGKAQGKSKRDCDLQFCKCLIKQCLLSARLDSGLSCPSLTYCVAVILFGGDAFTNARECCP